MEKVHCIFLSCFQYEARQVNPGEYSLQRINRDVPAFHKELLSAWFKHRPCRVRTHVPVSRRDILEEPLFLNKQITVDEVPLFYAYWIAAGLTRVKGINA